MRAAVLHPPHDGARAWSLNVEAQRVQHGVHQQQQQLRRAPDQRGWRGRGGGGDGESSSSPAVCCRSALLLPPAVRRRCCSAEGESGGACRGCGGAAAATSNSAATSAESRLLNMSLLKTTVSLAPREAKRRSTAPSQPRPLRPAPTLRPPRAGGAQRPGCDEQHPFGFAGRWKACRDDHRAACGQQRERCSGSPLTKTRLCL